MPTYVTYRCESIDCRKKFPWNPEDGFPKVCPHCGFEPEAIDDNVIALPAILSQKTRAADKVARQTMDGSADRALMAAQLTGESLADMNAMKLTNLQNDGSAEKPDNELTKHMEATGNGGFNAPPPLPPEAAAAPIPLPPQQVVNPSQHAQMAMGHAALAHQGKDHHAGARAMGSLQKALFNIK